MKIIIEVKKEAAIIPLQFIYIVEHFAVKILS